MNIPPVTLNCRKKSSHVQQKDSQLGFEPGTLCLQTSDVPTVTLKIGPCGRQRLSSHAPSLCCKEYKYCIITVCLQKQQSEASLYAVTDDDATIAYLLEKMREMDPEGVGIVRSEFKRYTLKRMHSGNLRQNHRLWRRLQTKMQKLGVLELDVHTVSLCCCSQERTHHPA